MAEFYVPFQTLSFEYDEKLEKTFLTSFLKVKLHTPDEYLDAYKVNVIQIGPKEFKFELYVSGDIKSLSSYEWENKIPVMEIANKQAYDPSKTPDLMQKMTSVRDNIILNLLPNPNDEFRVTAIIIDKAQNQKSVHNTISNTGTVQITV